MFQGDQSEECGGVMDSGCHLFFFFVGFLMEKTHHSWGIEGYGYGFNRPLVESGQHFPMSVSLIPFAWFQKLLAMATVTITKYF